MTLLQFLVWHYFVCSMTTTNLWYTVKPLVYVTSNLQTVMLLVSSCSCLCPIHSNQVLSREWRYSWSSADRWCSNYIWVINNFISYVSYIRGLTVCLTSNTNHTAWSRGLTVGCYCKYFQCIATGLDYIYTSKYCLIVAYIYIHSILRMYHWNIYKIGRSIILYYGAWHI